MPYELLLTFGTIVSSAIPIECHVLGSSAAPACDKKYANSPHTLLHDAVVDVNCLADVGFTAMGEVMIAMNGVVLG